MTIEFSFVGDFRTRLGESPLWDPARGRLWWVDVVDNRIAGSTPSGSDATNWRFDQTVGSIGLAQGGLVAALADGFYHIDGETGAAVLIARAPGVAAPLRFNDGKADRFGRFLSGTMKAGDLVSKASSLWRLDRDGGVHCLETGIGLSNAICFSPDGATLYFADSLEGVIRRYAYDGATGALGARDDFVDTRRYGSGPDGATVDAEGRLWVALIQAQAIGCFSPSGALLRKIDVPLPWPSCPAFGGPKMDTLFVTGISDSGHAIRADGEAAGRILAIKGLYATGLAEGRYVWDNHVGD
jgi:L-arabinonolactonase